MKKCVFKGFCLALAGLLICTSLPVTVQAQGISLPAPGTIVRLSPALKPPLLTGLKVHPDNPFRLDFVLDRGDETSAEAKRDSNLAKADYLKLIKYFLASLTIPEKDLWVNLSPYEKDRIVPEGFGQTEMGRDLLAQDYLLKQITASLIYPEDEVGKKFWQRVYAEAAEKFGTTQIPVNTFNKVWIVPAKAVVYENAKAGTAYVVESQLKVMLEEDYLAVEKNGCRPGDTFSGRCPQAGGQTNQPLNAKAPQGNPGSTLAQDIIRDIVLPELEREVNTGANFSQLRQVYNSLILATWYKKKIKDSILSQVYADKSKVAGLVSLRGTEGPEAIYQKYLEAFKKGAYNFIKEEPDPITHQPIPRKYFSGGVGFRSGELGQVMTAVRNFAPVQADSDIQVTTDFAMAYDDASVLETLKEILALVEPAQHSEQTGFLVVVPLNRRQFEVYSMYPNAFYHSKVQGPPYYLELTPLLKKEFIANVQRLIENPHERQNDMPKPVPYEYKTQGYMPGYHDNEAMSAEIREVVDSWPVKAGAMSQYILLRALEEGIQEQSLPRDVAESMGPLTALLNAVPNRATAFEQLRHDMQENIIDRFTDMNAHNIVTTRNGEHGLAVSGMTPSAINDLLSAYFHLNTRKDHVPARSSDTYKEFVQNFAGQVLEEKLRRLSGRPEPMSNFNVDVNLNYGGQSRFIPIRQATYVGQALRQALQPYLQKDNILGFVFPGAQWKIMVDNIEIEPANFENQMLRTLEHVGFISITQTDFAMSSTDTPTLSKFHPKVPAEKKIREVLENATNPLNTKAIAVQAGVSYVTTRAVLSRIPELGNHPKRLRERVRRSQEEKAEIYALLEYWLNQGPHTAAQLLEKLRTVNQKNVSIDMVEDDLNITGLRAHENFFANRTSLEIAADHQKLKDLLDNSQGQKYSIAQLADILGRTNGIIYGDLESIGYRNHENFDKRQTSEDRFNDLISQISEKALDEAGRRSILESFIFSGRLLFTKKQARNLARKKDLVNILRFLHRMLVYQNGRQTVFNSSQAYLIAIFYSKGTEDEIYQKIEWLTKGPFQGFFNSQQIARLILSNESLDRLKELILYLQKKAIFNSSHISEIIFGGATTEEIDDLIVFLQNSETGHGKFSPANIATIVALRRTVALKKDMVRYLISEGIFNGSGIARVIGNGAQLDDIKILVEFLKGKKLFNGTNISKIIYRKGPLEEKIRFVEFLLEQKNEYGGTVFNGFQITRIIANGATVAAKKQLIEYLHKQRAGDQTHLFSGADIRAAVENFSAFDKTIFESILAVFKDAGVQNTMALYWTIYREKYRQMLQEWLRNDYRDLPAPSKKLVSQLFSQREYTDQMNQEALTTRFDLKHMEALAKILYKKAAELHFRSVLNEKVKRLILLSAELDGLTSANDDYLKELLLSPDLGIRRQVIAGILKELSGLLKRFQARYNGQGDQLFYYIYSRYSWWRSKSGLNHLKGYLEFLIRRPDFGGSILRFVDLTPFQRRIFWYVSRWKKSADDFAIEQRLRSRGYSADVIAQAFNNFKTISLDATLSMDDSRTLYDMISTDDLDADYYDSDNPAEENEDREDATVLIGGRMERVFAANLVEALIIWLRKQNVSEEGFRKVREALALESVPFRVNQYPVKFSDVKSYFIESGDLIEVDLPVSFLDKAQTSQPKGGIDLNPAGLQLQGEGSGIKFQIDPAQLARFQNAPGLRPVIVRVQPMTDLKAFLGLTP